MVFWLRLQAPASITVRSGNADVEAAAVRLLGLLRYCEGQKAEVDSPDGRWKHVYQPDGAAPLAA